MKKNKPAKPEKPVEEPPIIPVEPQPSPKTVSKEQIVTYAREVIGTPTGHQGRIPGLALDCVGVVIYVARKLEIDVSGVMSDYGRTPVPATMREKLDEHLDRAPTAEMQLGDVVWVTVEGDPQHLGIIGRYPWGSNFSLIHAQNSSGVNRVVEHRLDDTWRQRIKAVWRFRNVE